MSSILDRTIGQIVDPTGAPVQTQATIIGADAAAILRNYFHWILQQQLEPELFCSSCYDGTRESKAVYHITEQEIQIVCRCQIRYFKGGWLTPETLTPNTCAKDDTIGLQLVTLSAPAARLLRLYKRVLSDLGLKEALRCNVCYKFDPSQDGCEAQVRAMNIRIRCRCSDRTFTGMSV
jgi:hypothetical protein